MKEINSLIIVRFYNQQEYMHPRNNCKYNIQKLMNHPVNHAMSFPIHFYVEMG